MQAAAAVLYELDQLTACYKLIAEIENEVDLYEGSPLCRRDVRETVRLAALEAMLVHIRCVIEFLVGRPPHEGQTSRRRHHGDVPPTWFAPTWDTPPGGHPLDEWLELIDAHLSHLSQKRIRFADDVSRDPVEWTGAMVRDVRDEAQRFVRAIDDIGRLAFSVPVDKLTQVLGEYPTLYTGS